MGSWLTRGERREKKRRNQRKQMVSNRSIFNFWRNNQQRQVDAITGGGVSVEEYATQQHRANLHCDEPPPLPDQLRTRRRAARKP